MTRLFMLIIAVTFLSACSLFKDKNEPLHLSDIGSLKVRLSSDEPLSVDHRDVIRSYQSYLEVGSDAEMRVRVAHRIAGLKLQWDEVRLEQFDENIDILKTDQRNNIF